MHTGAPLQLSRLCPVYFTPHSLLPCPARPGGSRGSRARRRELRAGQRVIRCRLGRRDSHGPQPFDRVRKFLLHCCASRHSRRWRPRGGGRGAGRSLSSGTWYSSPTSAPSTSAGAWSAPTSAAFADCSVSTGCRTAPNPSPKPKPNPKLKLDPESNPNLDSTPTSTLAAEPCADHGAQQGARLHRRAGAARADLAP